VNIAAMFRSTPLGCVPPKESCLSASALHVSERAGIRWRMTDAVAIGEAILSPSCSRVIQETGQL
jgi:hypothetical protein